MVGALSRYPPRVSKKPGAVQASSRASAKVWQIAACDAPSSQGVARILPELSARAVALFLRNVLVSAFSRAGWRVRRVLTERQ
jgi:hypothetical protein